MNARNRSLGYLGDHPETKQGKRLYPDNCNPQHSSLKSFRKPRQTNLSQGLEQPYSQKLRFQIATGFRSIPENLPHLSASVNLSAFSASTVALSSDTLANRTHFAAKDKLCTLYPASHAINMFGHDRGIVRLSPHFSGSLPKSVIIIDGGLAGIAFLAVQSTASNQIFHISYHFV